MSPNLWEAVNELIADAMELPVEERIAFVGSRAAKNDELRQTALDLLAHAGQLKTFLEKPVLADPMVFRSFLPDQVLAGRFRIISFLAEGGMGEVFEAEDLRSRHQRVALKTIRPEIAARPGILQRFESEVYHGKSIKHENICRVFDVHHHREPDDPEHETVFLTMEMLSGESLADRLKRAGRMRWGEALPLIKQMAAGLSAAHRAGVVHGDFKPANVMLVGNPARAVVMDLGLARDLVADEQSEMRSRYSTTPGTPGFMAPELGVSGPTIFSDIYALGAVIYAMVTGCEPEKPATSPQIGKVRLPRRWSRVIRRCLAEDPKARYGNVTDVIAALTPARDWQLAPLAIAALLILGLSAIVIFEARRHPARSVVAVLGFHNAAQSPDKEWLSAMLARSLEASLAESGYFRVVPDEDVERAKRDLGIAARNEYDGATLALLRNNLGIDVAISGVYSDAPSDHLELKVLIQRKGTGDRPELIWEGSEAETVRGIGALIAHASDVCVRTMSVTARLIAPPRAPIPEMSANLRATRFYEEGLTQLNLWDAAGAKALLQAAVEAQPDFALAHAALAEAYAALGYKNEAKREAGRAYALRERLPEHQSALLSARYFEINSQWLKAAEIYGSLYRAHRDDLNAGLHLVTAETMAGQEDAAFKVVAALRKLPVASRAGPQIDMAERQIWAMLSHYRESRDLAGRAAKVAEARQQWGLAAEARLKQGESCETLGEYDLSLQTLEVARDNFARLGNRSGVARALGGIANVYADRGDLDQAVAMYRDALTVFQDIGNLTNGAEAWNGLGNVLQLQGDLAGAEHAYQESLRMGRGVNYAHRIGSEMHSLGTLRQDQGRYAEALGLFEQARGYFKQAGNRLGQSFVDDNIGEILAIQGDLVKAREHGQAALKIRLDLGDEGYQAESWDDLGDVALMAGRINEAESDFRNSLELRERAHCAGDIATSKLNLAKLALTRGNGESAEKLVGESLAEFRRERRPRDLADGEIVLAESYLMQKRYTDAHLAIGSAKAFLDNSPYPLDQLRANVVSSRVLAATGEGVAAEQELAEALREADSLKAVPAQYEAELARAEILALAGRGVEAGKVSDAVKKRAEEDGIELYAYH